MTGGAITGGANSNTGNGAGAVNAVPTAAPAPAPTTGGANTTTGGASNADNAGNLQGERTPTRTPTLGDRRGRPEVPSLEELRLSRRRRPEELRPQEGRRAPLATLAISKEE